MDTDSLTRKAATGSTGRFFNSLEEDNPGKGDEASVLGKFLWIIGVAYNAMVSHERVRAAIRWGVVNRQGFLPFKGGEFLAPRCNYGVIPDADLCRAGVVLETQAECEDLLAAVKKVMRVVIALRVRLVVVEESGEAVGATNLMVWHLGSLA